MFVRWKTWKSYRYDYLTTAAYLVRSVRRDGKPRQRVVAYLGSIRLGYPEAQKPGPLGHPVNREKFWRRADVVLRVHVPDAEERARLTALVAEKAPRP